MTKVYKNCARGVVVGLLWLGALVSARAQESCLLVPVPLAERVAAAPLIVEAGVGAQQAVRSEDSHIYTLSQLTVYAVFRGKEPAALQLAEAGGTVGLRREVVSPGVALAPGQQGLFLLEPNPAQPGTYRLVAGPQGLVSYDLTARSATEPFRQYPSIAGALYPAVEALTGQPRRVVQPNAALGRAQAAARPVAQPVITGFAPASVAAGSGAVLTIDGANFGATQGSGHVDFPNANDGGSSLASANPTDYVSWTDTRIEVRVPSVVIANGRTAGTGVFRVVNAANETGSSPSALVVVYALSNVLPGGSSTPGRPRLVNDDGAGGYTLQYSPSFVTVTGAAAAFERALATWSCASRLRRVVGSPVSTEATPTNGVNEVSFGTLSAGVLGVTRSYFSGCFDGDGVVQFSLDETDYVFTPTPSAGTTWQFGPAAPGTAQYDFESVALHEQGHGTQLTHIIDPTAVMHFSLTNSQTRRTLSTASDVAGAADVFTYSLTNPCGDPGPVATAVPAGCLGSLPVELTAFSARYQAGRGTQLDWATAAEHHSAYFALESQEAGAAAWQEIGREPAAGTSARAHTYQAHDPRPLAGTRYYRLRQVDQDGTTAYSPLAAVSGAEDGLSLYPNPVAGRLQVGGPARAGQLRCYDLAGREVARFALTPGPNDLDVGALPAGLYQVEWTDGATTRRARLQKL
ncbi:IPT/TIG domain-containing protein [Hymenobacter ruricola]|uniref:IPT/TIG domain-containing protein n=1 Tax=Hymenobacter ruricola TaxID=2791023 RepID=A0ABS0I2G4_9BACT|nr:IPT/TIG domain-containing protein [Hymenobacter ruricola]MBF9221130.1 IPT/TIG domain-containing protein [Hymenobacter ruricola]